MGDSPEAHHVVPNQVGNPNNPAHDWLRSVDNWVYLCKEVCHREIGRGGNTVIGAGAPADNFLFSHDGEENSANHQASANLLMELTKKALRYTRRF